MPSDPKSVWEVIKTATAWESIGWDDGPFRIKGGRAIYQAVNFQCGPREGRTVLLSRLGNYRPEWGNGTEARGLQQHDRRVMPETVLEFLKPSTNLPPTP